MADKKKTVRKKAPDTPQVTRVQLPSPEKDYPSEVVPQDLENIELVLASLGYSIIDKLPDTTKVVRYLKLLNIYGQPFYMYIDVPNYVSLSPDQPLYNIKQNPLLLPRRGQFLDQVKPLGLVFETEDGISFILPGKREDYLEVKNERSATYPLVVYSQSRDNSQQSLDAVDIATKNLRNYEDRVSQDEIINYKSKVAIYSNLIDEIGELRNIIQLGLIKDIQQLHNYQASYTSIEEIEANRENYDNLHYNLQVRYDMAIENGKIGAMVKSFESKLDPEIKVLADLRNRLLEELARVRKAIRK